MTNTNRLELMLERQRRNQYRDAFWVAILFAGTILGLAALALW